MKKEFHPTPAILEKIREAASKGVTEAAIARTICNYAPTYFSEVKKQHPEIAEAITQGRCEGETVVVSKLWELIEKGNFPAISKWLDRYAGWKEPVTVAVVTPEDLTDEKKDTLKELLKKKVKDAA